MIGGEKMNIKKQVIFSMMILIFTIVTGCGSGSTKTTEQASSEEKAEKVTLKVSAYFASTSPIYTAITEPWMKRVTELTDGKVEFDYFPSEQLGKAGDSLNLTKDGVTDISVFATTYAPDLMPLTNMLNGLPNLSENSHQGTMAMNELINENVDFLQMEYLNNGVRPIFAHVSPTFEIWALNKEFRVPEDLKGLKIRTPGGVANEFYEFINAIPVAVPFPESYEAIEKGVIDAYSSYSMGLKNGGLDELLNFVITPHIGTTIHAFIINEKVWQKLPKEIQEAMIQAGNETMENAGAVYVEEGKKFDENFVQNGGTIAELTAEEQEQWKQATEEFTATWLKEHESDGPPYEEVLNLYKEKLVKYKENE